MVESKFLVFVESPLQLINSLEFKEKFSNNHFHFLIRLSGVDNNDAQLKKLVDIFNLHSDVTFFCFKGKGRTLSDYFFCLLRFIQFGALCCFFEYVIIGNLNSKFSSPFANFFNRNKVIYVDDGNSTLLLPDNRRVERSIFFTSYSIDKDKYETICNDYSLIKSLSNDAELNNEMGRVIFIGSGVCELDMITAENYLSMVRAVANYFKVKGKEVVYIPHRVESDERVKEISNIDNVTVDRIDYPIELYGIYNDKPKEVLSFYSSALISLNRVYGAEITSIYFECENLKYKDEVNRVYEEYASEMKVVGIDSFCVKEK